MGSQQSKINKMLAFHLLGLEELLISMADRVQKEANLSKPKRIGAQMDIRYNGPMQIKNYIDIDIKYEDKEILCYNILSSYQIKCHNTENTKESFELSDISQNSSFLERTLCEILGAYDILYPRALKVKGKIPKHIEVYTSTHLDGPERKYLERTYEDKVFIDGVDDFIAKSVKYNIGKSSIEIATFKY
jgi:hypothetical protein